MAEQPERRRFHRFPFDADCTLDFGSAGEHDCELLDLSLNGALVRMPEPTLSDHVDGQPAKAASLRLHVSGLVRGDQAEMDMMVQVVRVENDTLACRFVAVEAESFVVLKTLVVANLGDAGLLDRELSQLDYWPGLSIAPSSRSGLNQPDMT